LTATRATMLGRISRLATIVAIATAAACGNSGDSTTTPPVVLPTTPVGVYTITMVNGKAPPVTVLSDTSGLYKLEVTSGTFTITADGKYSTVMNTRQTIPNNVSVFTDSTGGTWLLSGTSVSFTNSQDGTKDTAVWSNTGSLTFAEVDGTTTTTIIYGLKK
ncbi:MAG: hypothetical protein ABI442_15755, partial [Gemmatimonadaceae bacterium]